ncbi:MAG: recombinase family protein [Candidatus Thorarchaeota archaeon]|jgi:DNA invertase Pin-like site-specific DNA recombinase
MRAIIYARCSTDDKKQDVEVQLKQLREYCQNNNWDYDEVSEYASGSKGVPPKLQQVLDLIAQRVYQIIIVHSLDRFSRLSPKVTEQMLNHIVDCDCRFIALSHNLDSDNEMTWYAFKGLFAYFSNLYSKQLSEKVKLGMERAREKGIHVGRPKGSRDKKPRIKKGYYNRKYKFKLK